MKVLTPLKRSFERGRRFLAGKRGSAAYWSVFMVANDEFGSAEDSLSHFHWRNAQYPGYIDLMPVTGQDDKVVVDYGCGPGNDLVGFAVYSNPNRLIGIDVSMPALERAQHRLSLHGKPAEFTLIDEVENDIPLQSGSVDFIHTSGVLHHCANLEKVLQEFYRILRTGGELQVMVYNYQSLWLHLYTAYIQQLEMGKYRGLPVLEAFRRTTDGEDCPISLCYKPPEFVSLLAKHGFEGEFRGAAISILEMKTIDKRFDAISDQRLAKEHRDFLIDLTFNERGVPLYKGEVAGIDACYKFRKID